VLEVHGVRGVIGFIAGSDKRSMRDEPIGDI
jgi:hypothetical protein